MTTDRNDDMKHEDNSVFPKLAIGCALLVALAVLIGGILFLLNVFRIFI